jgi:hypothetical protein
MKKDDFETLITPAQAARLRGVSVQAIVNLMDRERLPFLTIAGKRFLKSADVLSYKPDKGGRPSKSAVSAEGKKKPAAKAAKKNARGTSSKGK